ncbi:MAG: sensor histidine kinase [Eubacterium sp.]
MINKDIKLLIIFGVGATVLCSAVCAFFNIWCGLICFVLGLVITCLFYCITRGRYADLYELNNYLAQICSGNYDLDISDNMEGELSILKNNLYKVITLLKTQNEMLANDKIQLADSLADISHQLKTPLTSMMVMTDLLKAEPTDGKTGEFVSVIDTQLEKMSWLITNLLKLSKLDAGTVELAFAQHSITDVVNACLSPFLLTLELKNITVNCNIDDFEFCGDSNWTVEAIQNVFKNCIEHTQKDGLLSISTNCTNVYDELVISDNGCGIKKKDLPHIFERFYHGENSSGESVGIGLALAKAVLEKERASISVDSVCGEGTTFSIKFYKYLV